MRHRQLIDTSSASVRTRKTHAWEQLVGSPRYLSYFISPAPPVFLSIVSSIEANRMGIATVVTMMHFPFLSHSPSISLSLLSLVLTRIKMYPGSFFGCRTCTDATKIETGEDGCSLYSREFVCTV